MRKGHSLEGGPVERGREVGWGRAGAEVGRERVLWDDVTPLIL